MKGKILWIEDDYYAIKGLFRPLSKQGFELDVATSAVEGYEKAQEWSKYILIMVDLIIPLCDRDQEIPNLVQNWSSEKHVGIGLAKWLVSELKVGCPVLLLSVVRDPIREFKLTDYRLEHYLSKSGLLPSKVQETVLNVLSST